MYWPEAERTLILSGPFSSMIKKLQRLRRVTKKQEASLGVENTFKNASQMFVFKLEKGPGRARVLSASGQYMQYQNLIHSNMDL